MQWRPHGKTRFSWIFATIAVAAVTAAADQILIDASTNLVDSQSGLYTNDSVVVDGSNTVLTLFPHSTYGTLVEYFFANLALTNGARVLCKGQNVAPRDADAKGVAIAAAGDVTVAS